jgi:hypothetical protein
VCSLTLAAIVILNAQFGCDSPASTAPPPAEPTKKDEAQPTKSAQPAPTPDPTKVEPPADPAVEPAASPEPGLGNSPAENPPSNGNADVRTPVYMPASKSGGDFGAVHFPGQANPAPTPQQQAPQ